MLLPLSLGTWGWLCWLRAGSGVGAGPASGDEPPVLLGSCLAMGQGAVLASLGPVPTLVFKQSKWMCFSVDHTSQQRGFIKRDVQMKDPNASQVSVVVLREEIACCGLKELLMLFWGELEQL